MLTRMDVKFEWKETHRCTFMKLKDTIIKAPILRYPDASNNACGAQFSQMHKEAKFPVAFLSHTFTDTQQRWEYTRTGSIQHLFRSQEMELLPTRSRHYSKKRPQAFSMVLKWEE